MKEDTGGRVGARIELGAFNYRFPNQNPTASPMTPNRIGVQPSLKRLKGGIAARSAARPTKAKKAAKNNDPKICFMIARAPCGGASSRRYARLGHEPRKIKHK